jgi:hypothetical protein
LRRNWTEAVITISYLLLPNKRYAVINYTINEPDCDEKYKHAVGEGQYFVYEDKTKNKIVVADALQI